MLPYELLELRYYLVGDGKRPFEQWYSGLDAAAGAKVAVALARLEQGNLSNVRPVDESVRRIDWGPGYRVYFGRDGEVLVILLTGGTKKRQQRDIDTAKTKGFQVHMGWQPRQKGREMIDRRGDASGISATNRTGSSRVKDYLSADGSEPWPYFLPWFPRGRKRT